MTKINEKVAEITTEKTKNKGGRPRKHPKQTKQKERGIANKRIRRMGTTDLDITACSAALHECAQTLYERVFDDDLALHYDFRAALLIRIRAMQELARGLALHRTNPHPTAYKTLEDTNLQLAKEVQAERARRAKEKALYPNGLDKTDIVF